MLRANVSDLLVYRVLPYAYIDGILTLFPARQALLLDFRYLSGMTRHACFSLSPQDYIQDLRHVYKLLFMPFTSGIQTAAL